MSQWKGESPHFQPMPREVSCQSGAKKQECHAYAACNEIGS